MYIYKNILSSGELFNPYHLSPEPEKSIDMGMNILPDTVDGSEIRRSRPEMHETRGR